VVGFDARLFKLFFIEFRISTTPSQLEFELMELEGFQFLPIHHLYFRVEIFSDLHGSPIPLTPSLSPMGRGEG
jgi:hypothetical protein